MLQQVTDQVLRQETDQVLQQAKDQVLQQETDQVLRLGNVYCLEMFKANIFLILPFLKCYF